MTFRERKVLERVGPVLITLGSSRARRGKSEVKSGKQLSYDVRDLENAIPCAAEDDGQQRALVVCR